MGRGAGKGFLSGRMGLIVRGLSRSFTIGMTETLIGLPPKNFSETESTVIATYCNKIPPSNRINASFVSVIRRISCLSYDRAFPEIIVLKGLCGCNDDVPRARNSIE